MTRKSILNVVAVSASVVLVAAFAAFLGREDLQNFFARYKANKTVSKKSSQAETSDEGFLMTVRGRLAEVQKCYDAQLKQGLRKSGSLVVKWAVDAQGRASDFQEEVNELDSTELYDCTVVAIGSWPFPKQRPTYIRYTFKMKALDKEKVLREISSASHAEPGEESAE